MCVCVKPRACTRCGQTRNAVGLRVNYQFYSFSSSVSFITQEKCGGTARRPPPACWAGGGKQGRSCSAGMGVGTRVWAWARACVRAGGRGRAMCMGLGVCVCVCVGAGAGVGVGAGVGAGERVGSD